MKPLRLGVIGTGSVVREIYQYLYFNSDYSDLIEVAGICDLDRKCVDEFGDMHSIPRGRRFTDYKTMCSEVELDCVAVNTPDAAHTEPILHAFDSGLDVIVAKPLAATIEDAYAILEKRESCGRYLGTDYHKREDPRIREARMRFRRGDYGPAQSSVWYMIDKLMIADPNHEPRFFATADFAARNTPVSFLTVHIADAFMYITGLEPLEVRATGFKQKLVHGTPLSIDGYDLVDTEVVFENGALAHFISGWALPNTAHAPTVQSARIIGRDGLLDLGMDTPGYHEIIDDGIHERNPLFRNVEPEGHVSGYGISSPGKILKNIHRFRNGHLTDAQVKALQTPYSVGFYTTLVCEAAHISLEQGAENGNGVVRGDTVTVRELIDERLGEDNIL